LNKQRASSKSKKEEVRPRKSRASWSHTENGDAVAKMFAPEKVAAKTVKLGKSERTWKPEKGVEKMGNKKTEKVVEKKAEKPTKVAEKIGKTEKNWKD